MPQGGDALQQGRAGSDSVLISLKDQPRHFWLSQTPAKEEVDFLISKRVSECFVLNERPRAVRRHLKITACS